MQVAKKRFKPNEMQNAPQYVEIAIIKFDW